MSNPATCPWADWAPATIQFCEKRLCAWIVEPANTWSNIFFALVGIWIWRRAQQSGRRDLTIIGGSAVFLGFSSGMFHASGTFFWEFFDLAGMFLISSMMVTLNLRRWLALEPRMVMSVFLLLVGTSMGLMLYWRPAGVPVFGTHLAAALTIEVFVHLRGDMVRYRSLASAVGFFALSFILWMGDVSGKLCNPDNHIFTGHAAWHAFNACSLYCMYHFYKQFDLTVAKSAGAAGGRLT